MSSATRAGVVSLEGRDRDRDSSARWALLGSSARASQGKRVPELGITKGFVQRGTGNAQLFLFLANWALGLEARGRCSRVSAPAGSGTPGLPVGDGSVRDVECRGLVGKVPLRAQYLPQQGPKPRCPRKCHLRVTRALRHLLRAPCLLPCGVFSPNVSPIARTVLSSGSVVVNSCSSAAEQLCNFVCDCSDCSDENQCGGCPDSPGPQSRSQALSLG